MKAIASFTFLFLSGIFLLIIHFNYSIPFADSGSGASDVHVHWNLLFLVQDWDADVLLVNSKTNKLCQLAYDMLVSRHLLNQVCIEFYDFTSKLMVEHHSNISVGWLRGMHLRFLTTSSISFVLKEMPKLSLKRCAFFPIILFCHQFYCVA